MLFKTGKKYFYRWLALRRDKARVKYESDRAYAHVLKRYVGRPILDIEEINQKVYDLIQSNQPFFVGRLGGFELLNMRATEFGDLVGQRFTKEVHFSHLCNNAGFFPPDISFLPRFLSLMQESCKEVDVLAVWFNAFEDYYIRKFVKKESDLCYLLDIEPWASETVHWSAALEGKKVLLIHPFEATIQEQYQKRELIFKDTDILPVFELKTLKAVQTIAGETDDRFATWFEALDWMYQEAMKIDFDVAIIGCGAYGFPLGAKLKKAGKQAIHLGGVTQLLFGIWGERWTQQQNNQNIRRYDKSAWITPLTEDIPAKAQSVEWGCYW